MVVPKHVEHKMLIEKIHEEIGHFGAMWTFAEVKKRFFCMTQLKLSRNSSRLVKSVS
jgi:hypothetical protein